MLTVSLRLRSGEVLQTFDLRPLNETYGIRGVALHRAELLDALDEAYERTVETGRTVSDFQIEVGADRPKG